MMITTNYLVTTGAVKTNRKIADLIVYFMIVLIASFYLSNLNGGHNWGGDFSMYIMNAKNIAFGHPYGQTPYIYNPDTAVYGPKAYPPVFPLMLAPIILLWGVNFIVLKMVGIACFVVLLFYLKRYILPENFPHVLSIMYVFIVGLYPSFFMQADNVVSDIPFVLFCMVSLKQINNQVLLKAFAKLPFINACLTGIFIYLAYGTRTIGICLLPVILLLDLITNKGISLKSIITLSVSFLMIVLQSLIIPEVGGYVDQLPKTIGEVTSILIKSFTYYFSIFYKLFRFNNSIIQLIVFILVLTLVVIGFNHRIKRQISSYDLFVLIYLFALLFWPSFQGIRFIFPILPLYFLFGLEGFQYLISAIKFRKWMPNAISILLFFGIGVYYIGAYTSLIPRPLSEINKRETQELFQYVRSKTNTNEVIVFFKPRVLALFTDRKSVALAVPSQNGDTLKRMDDFNVRYVIVRVNYFGGFQPQWVQFIKENSNRFRLLYNNDEFLMYQYLNGEP